MKLVFASNNPNKLQEVRYKLGEAVNVVSLKDIACFDNIPEPHPTLELNALEKAGSTDPEAIAKVLKTQDVETPFGAIRFDEKGDATGVGFSVYQVKEGKYVQVQ